MPKKISNCRNFISEHNNNTNKRTKCNWVRKKNTNELKKSWQDLKVLNPSLMNAMKYKCFTNLRIHQISDLTRKFEKVENRI